MLDWGPGKPGPTVVADGVQLDHHPDPKKSRGQYLPLLELSVAEDPEDDRNVHYLGREYLYYGRWDDCIATLKRHLAMPSAVWPDERAASMRYIAAAYDHKEMPDQARDWYLRAVAEAPHLREPYIDLAQLLYAGRSGTGCCISPAAPWPSPDRPRHLYLRGRPLGQSAPRPAVHRLLRHRSPAPGLRRGPPGPGAGTGQRKTM